MDKIFANAIHNISHHCFADDTQSYTDAPLPQVRMVADKLQRCIVDVADWSGSRRLQLNRAKTDLMWFGSSTSLQSVSSLNRSIVVSEDIIQPSNSVCYLGMQFENEMNICTQIAKITQTCFFHIRRLCQVRRVLGCQLAAQLVSVLVISPLDHGNGTLAGLPQSTFASLQWVLIDAAERLVCDLHPRDSVTSALIGLHWLPVPAHVEFKLCTIVYQSLHGSAPHYINDML